MFAFGILRSAYRRFIQALAIVGILFSEMEEIKMWTGFKS